MQAVQVDEASPPDAVESLLFWWQEHANLCSVAATIPPSDFSAREVVLRSIEESLERGEVMLRALLLENNNARRSYVAARDGDPYKAIPHAQGMVPTSGMNRFDERVGGAVRLMRPLGALETKPTELQPSRTYLKK